MLSDKPESRSGTIVVGILGGIGSGKSLVAEQLRQMGAEVDPIELELGKNLHQWHFQLVEQLQ